MTDDSPIVPSFAMRFALFSCFTIEGQPMQCSYDYAPRRVGWVVGDTPHQRSFDVHEAMRNRYPLMLAAPLLTYGFTQGGMDVNVTRTRD